MDIKENIFDLTEDQIILSKKIYNGKIIKCLVAPFHNYTLLQGIVFYAKNIYLYPEREMSYPQIKSFVNMIINGKTGEEIIIITSNINIISDIIDGCVRILTEDGKIVPCSIKTFLANIHTIQWELMENEKYRIDKNERTLAQERISKVVDKVQDSNPKKTISIEDFNKIIEEIEMIGEVVIKSKLKEMANNNLIIKN